MSWEYININKICRPRQWKTLSMDKLQPEGFPVYGANGKIGFYSEYTHEFPTLAITCRGATCGSVHITDPCSYINGNAMALDHISDKIDIKFLYYYFVHRGFKDVISGSAQPQITGEGLSTLEIPLPPLATQKRIAEILDAADALRRKDQELLKKYDELAQAIFIDMFGDPEKNQKGWEVKNLEKITTKLGDGLHGTPDYSIDGDYHFINGNNLEDGTISVNESTKKVDESEFLKHKKELTENTMLVSINGTIGKAAFYRGEKIILGKSACYFNVDKKEVALIYLYSLIKSNYFIKYAGGNATGSTIKNVSLKTMREFPVPLPPISYQIKYGERISLIWETIKVINRCEKKELFNSLIQKAFKGELVE